MTATEGIIQPATIAEHKALGCRTLMAGCDDCHREAVVYVAGFPDAFPIPDWR
jgi:hypothetical protein